VNAKSAITRCFPSIDARLSPLPVPPGSGFFRRPPPGSGQEMAPDWRWRSRVEHSDGTRLAQSRTAARSAERSESPFDLARTSSCFQTGTGNRIDLGTVGPVSVPILGRPLRTWTIPSAATRAAYGLRRTLAVPVPQAIPDERG
jgi:hypothetical protein